MTLNSINSAPGVAGRFAPSAFQSAPPGGAALGRGFNAIPPRAVRPYSRFPGALPGASGGGGGAARLAGLGVLSAVGSFLLISDILQSIQDNYNPIGQLQQQVGMTAPNIAGGRNPTEPPFSPNVGDSYSVGFGDTIRIGIKDQEIYGIDGILRNRNRTIEYSISGQATFSIEIQQHNTYYNRVLIKAGGLPLSNLFYSTGTNGIVYAKNYSIGGDKGFGGIESVVVINSATGQSSQWTGDPSLAVSAPPQTKPAPVTNPQQAPRPVAPPFAEPSDRPELPPEFLPFPAPAPGPAPTRPPAQEPNRNPAPAPIVPLPLPRPTPGGSPIPFPVGPGTGTVIDPITGRPVPSTGTSPNNPVSVVAIVTNTITETITQQIIERVPVVTTITNTVYQTPPRDGNCPEFPEIPEFECKFSECAKVSLCEPEKGWLENLATESFSGSQSWPECEELEEGSLPILTEWEGTGTTAILQAIESQNKAIERILRWICELGDRKPTLAVPDDWEFRTESKRRQMIIIYRNRMGDGTFGKADKRLVIPHYSGTRKPRASEYTSGRYFAMATLSDNSKIMVYAVSPLEATRIAEEMLAQVRVAFSRDSLIRVGEVKGRPIIEARRVPYKWILLPSGSDSLSTATEGFF